MQLEVGLSGQPLKFSMRLQISLHLSIWLVHASKMPHKHTRRRGDDDADFNLAPSTIAKPLSAYNKDNGKASKRKPGPGTPDVGDKKRNGRNGYKHDDTPRAFARLMTLQSSNKRQRSGLDDGEGRPSKKKRRQAATADETIKEEKPQEDMAEMPKILPGERLADFAARVNHALPVSGLARKGKINVEGMKERQTKTEKRLHKMYDEWRREEARRKEQEEEKRELEEEAEEEKEAAHGGQSTRIPNPTALSKRRKRRKMIGETGDDDDDPWAELKAKREAPKGLHDVAQAPPNLERVREKFKTKNGAKVQVVDVPNAAGSLKRREELSDARKEVIERYRAMMGRGG